MKINLPVTGVEHQLVPGRPVVTKTDLKGIITYCNQALMEQMSVAIGEISSNTEIALAAARRTAEVANAGMASMAASIASSRKAIEVVSASSQRIAEVNASMGRIANISQTIREIADQTNLLALNAAIEAASTVEITAAVEAIVAQSRTAVRTMEAASQEVTQGTARVEDSSGGLQVICEASREALTVSGEITGMLRQQSTTSHEVANSMELVSAAADAAHATVAEVGVAATGLRQTAEELRLLLRHMESAVTG